MSGNGQVATELSLYVSEDPQDYTPQRIELMKRTIARGASDDELALFIEQCKRTRLDPFVRQIYSIRRKQWNAQARTYEEAQVIQVSIDGFRLVADRTGKYAGQAGPWWCGPDGQWVEVWLEDTPPAAAKVGVLRHDFHQPMYGIALYKSYVQANAHGEPISRWKTDPAGMLAKCAESLALRRAFPNDLSGLYTTEEMEQADNPLTLPTTPTTPALSLPVQEGAFFDETDDGTTTPNGSGENAVKTQDVEKGGGLLATAQFLAQATPEEPTDSALLDEDLAAMTLEQARMIPDSHGKLYGDIDPEQLAYRYNNMVKMLGKVDAEKEQEYRLKMRAIELIQKAAQGQAKEKKILKELGYSDAQPALVQTDADPYADLKAKTAANREKGTKGDWFSFWQLIERAGWNRTQAKAIVDAHKGDANGAFDDLLLRVINQ